jgi:hypothetical protein
LEPIDYHITLGGKGRGKNILACSGAPAKDVDICRRDWPWLISPCNLGDYK